MKKLRWLLFMPFFIACGGKEQSPLNNTATQLKQLLAAASVSYDSIKQRYIDSLLVIGADYTWTKNVNIKDTGFRSYILLNAKIGDSIWQWTNKAKASLFLKRVVKHENILKTDSLSSIFTNALFKLTERDFSYVYDEDIVKRFEKCLAYHDKDSALSARNYFIIHQQLSIAYNVLGEKELAKQYYDKVLRLANNSTKKASASINLYSYFIEYNQYDSVIANAPAIIALPDVPSPKLAMLKAYLAEALYATGNPTYKSQLDNAWTSLQQIPFEQVGEDELGKKSDVLKLKGEIALREKEYEKAKGFFKKAIDTCFKKTRGKRPEREYAKLLLRLGTAYGSTQQYDSALYYSQLALYYVNAVNSINITTNPTLQDIYPENTIMEALDSKADFLERKHTLTQETGLLSNAVASYELAFAVEQKLMANFTYDSSRAAILSHSKLRSSKAIAICYQLYRLTHDDTWAEKAFQFSESSKALILLEAIKKNIYNNRYQNNPLFKKVDSLQLQLNFAEKQLAKSDKESRTVAAERKTELERLLLLEQQHLDRSELSYKNYRQQQDTALLTNLKQKLLTKNRNLVEFFSMDKEAYLFVVKKSGQLYFTKLDSGINQEIKNLMGYYTSSDSIDPASYRQAAYHLYQTCRLPEALPIGELLIIPDGLFNQIPFDALVTSDVDKGFAKMDYLLKKATVSYGYSAASLLKQLSGGYTVNDKIAAFAPVFANNERGLNALQASKMEINSIHPKWPYIGHQATVANFRNSLNHAGIIHIASHAGADTGASPNPWVEMYDSAFHMNELYATPLRNTNLVVLSACQTNQGKLDQSEGTLSLARGFYYAGAKNIVASLWKVDDESTADIVHQFYTAGNSNDYAAKLHKAKEQYLSNPKIQTKGKTAPYYWAALMHIGGFRQSTDLPKWFGYSIIAALVLAIGIFYWRSRK